MGETSLDRVREWVDPYFNSLLDLLFPRRCAGCGRAGEVWCLSCHDQLELFPPGRCQRCQTALFGKGIFCQSCWSRQSHPPIACYARYRQPLQRALLTLKYRPDQGLASVMADWMAETWHHSGWQATLVVPVPLSQPRFRKRGFNQAEVLGEAVAKALELKYRPEALMRIRDTGSQVGLDHRQRRLNVADAFQADPTIVRGEQVLIVDDLVTTGSTMEACAMALEAADSVCGMAVARA